MSKADELIKQMAEALIREETDLGDEREILRDLQQAGFLLTDVVMYSDQAAEEARTLTATGSSSGDLLILN